MAYWRRKPPKGLLAHSDRGVQYASREYRKLIADFRIARSMSRRACCWDNAAMQTVFKTLKVERADRVRYETRNRARPDVVLGWKVGTARPASTAASAARRLPASSEASSRLDPGGCEIEAGSPSIIRQ